MASSWMANRRAISGESMPAEKRPGSRVLAGTINQTGALEIDIERFGRDTTFGGAVDVVELGAHARADPVGEGLHH